MARGRMINRKTGESAKVARLHAEYGGDATTFFCLLLAWLDVNGNVRADDWWLKGNVCPEVAGLLPGNCRAISRALAAVGLAVPYEVAGKTYLHFPGFREEQPGLRPDRERAEVPQIPKDVLAEWMRATAGQLPGNLPATAGQLPARAAAEVEVEVEVEVGSKALSHTPREDSPTNGDRPSPPDSDPLASWLGEHAPAVEHLAAIRDPAFRLSLHALYGPRSAHMNTWKRSDGGGVPPAEQARLFAVALLRYFGGAKPKDYHGSEFAATLRRVITDDVGPPQKGPDFGNETQRDTTRRREAEARQHRTEAERREQAEREHAARERELNEWLEARTELEQRAIRKDAKARVNGSLFKGGKMREAAEVAALMGAIEEARARATSTEAVSR